MLLINISVIEAQIFEIKKPAIWIETIGQADSTAILVDRVNGGLEIENQVKYKLGKINFTECIEIDSIIDPILLNYYWEKGKDITIFVAYKANDDIEGVGIWTLKSGSGKILEISNKYIKDDDKVIDFSDTAITKVVVNLLKYRWTKEIDSLESYVKIIGNDSLNFRGKFAEFMMYDTALTYLELEKIHTYFGIKYGVGIKNFNYVNSIDTIIWDYEKNKEYSNNIAGIGRDSLLKIYQKQSSGEGGESILTIWIGELAEFNKDNPSEINELDYLIWGDNNKDFNNFLISNNDDEYITYLSERKWLMECSGSTVREINTNLSVYAPDIDDSLTLALVINSEANIDFPYATSRIIYPDSVGDGVYYYYNVRWDIDSSGSDIFTFKEDSILTLDSLRSLLDNGENNDTENNENGLLESHIESINFYPNPTNGYYNGEIILSNVSDVYISIYDENAKIIKKNRYTDNSLYTIMGFLEGKGIYFIVIETNTDKKVYKLVVQ
jgi:hypothetical protein